MENIMKLQLKSTMSLSFDQLLVAVAVTPPPAFQPIASQCAMSLMLHRERKLVYIQQQKKKKKPSFSASWREPFCAGGSSGPGRCPDPGESGASSTRTAVWGWGSVAPSWFPVGPGAAGVSWSSPFPAGGRWLSPRCAPSGRESSPSLPPRTEPSAPWSTATVENRAERLSN